MNKFQYVAERNPKDSFDLTIVVEDENGRSPLKQVVRHSPTGMEWGYGGSGPADTALSILTDYVVRTGLRSNRKKAIDMVSNNGLYMDFKWKFIEPANREGFTITDVQVGNWLNQKIRDI